MTPSRLFRGGAALFGLLCFAALATSASAQQPGRGPKLPDTVKLEADIPFAGTDNPPRHRRMPSTSKSRVKPDV